VPNEALSLIWSNRHALAAIVKNEIRQRYAGSFLGIAWLFLYPLFFLALYSGVYLLIFKIRVPEFSDWRYVLLVFSGLVPYLGFSESLQQGSRALTGNANLLKNTVFAPELIPVKTVLASQATHAVSLAVLTLGVLASGHRPGLLWLLPVVFLAQIVLTQGIVWVLSALSVAVKDVPHVTGLAVLFLLFVSPVAFTPDMVPQRFQVFLHLNPLHYVIALYRAALFETAPFAFRDLLILAGMSLAAFAGGFYFFRKMKGVFLEYV